VEPPCRGWVSASASRVPRLRVPRLRSTSRLAKWQDPTRALLPTPDYLEKLLRAAERSRSALLRISAFLAVETLEPVDAAFASGAARAQLQG
jgi:hypothetical protein